MNTPKDPSPPPQAPTPAPFPGTEQQRQALLEILRRSVPAQPAEQAPAPKP